MTKNQIHDIESLEDLNNLELQLKKIFTKMNGSLGFCGKMV